MEDRVAPLPTVPDDLRAMLDLLAETIVQALGFGVAVINIARPDGALEVVSVAGDQQARDTLLGTSDSAETWDQIMQMSEPWGELRFADHRNEAANPEVLSWVPDFEPTDLEGAWHPEDALFAPLSASDGSRIGILSVDLPRDNLRPDAITCGALEAFAVSAALAIDQATQRARAEASERSYRDLATLDRLTGLGDRSVLTERLQHAVTARPDSRGLIALVFVDLDDFKPVNDTYSHLAGDHVLQAVAQRLSSVVRAHDTVVRWGGDEFVVLLERLEDETAGLTVVQRISAELSQPIRYLDVELGVTASMGVAFLGAGEVTTVDELVRRADEAMYQAKRNGRNTCSVFGAAG